MQRVYLDHAATSWPRPAVVLEALVEYETQCGATAGRGRYTSAVRASQTVASVRRKLAALIGARSPDEIALLHNGTAALNLAFAGLLKSGDHVVTTAAEHNSVLRPLAFLAGKREIEFTIVPCDKSGYVSPSQIESSIRPSTKLVAITHASNVTGQIQSIDEISKIAKRNSVWLLVDAAQTLGYIPIDVQSLGIDVLAAPGHKGAGGMLGTGLLYARQEIAEAIQNPWPGGTGTQSGFVEGPFAWPAGVESGNLNLPALAGWAAGLDWLADGSIALRQTVLARLHSRLLEILRASSLGQVIGHESLGENVAVISLKTTSLASSDLAAILDSSFRIEVRSGLHCAAKIHDYLETRSQGGTLRFSLGHTSTSADLDALEAACREIRTHHP